MESLLILVICQDNILIQIMEMALHLILVILERNKMKPIWFYCRETVKGWEKIPNGLLYLPDDHYSFLNTSLGIQMTCCTREFSSLVIHVSLGPVKSINPSLTEKEILNKAFGILQDFFGDLLFIRQPDHPLKPDVKHFFHLLSRRIPAFSEN